MRVPHKKKAISLMLASALFSGAALAAEDQVELTDIEVIGTTPMHGVGLPADEIPANIQSANAEDIERVQALDLSDFMNKTLGSVSLNQAQNNPFQPDLKFRGFTASPLVGNSQGLSVYMDGIRINEPFGDAVNFELIPESAIASMNLIPGSNPVFGLNTLGGALSIQTKNGFTHQGHSLEAYTGSFGRDSGTIESGGSDGNFAYFVTGSITKEDGWRDESPSRVEQFFSNLSYANEDTTLDLGITAVDSDLNGNGASPVELVAQDREAVFTHPDNTQNELRMFTLNGSHWLNETTMLSANTYYRRSDRSTFNGDGSELSVIGGEIGEDEDDDDVLDEVVSDDAAALGFADDDDVALNNTSKTEQDSYGFGLQTTFLDDLFGRQNQLIVGASYDKSDVDHSSQSEIAQFTSSRGTDGTGFIIDETVVDGDIETETYSLYFTNTYSLTERLALTVAGRYNHIEIDISGTSEGGEQDLNESGNNHVFARFNPSLGMTYAIRDNLSTYANYSESNRAPTPSELTCADADNPCSLPNSFLADPPLDDIVARTIEAGLRGQNGSVNWNAGVFYTELKDDLFFFPATEEDPEDPRLNVGIFDNIDKTARAGLELGAFGNVDKLDWFANYSYVRATFEDEFQYAREVDDELETFTVKDGDRLPGIPAHNIKIGADYGFTQKLSMGFTASYHSSQYFRGDEANVDKKIGHYKVVNLHGRYKATKNLQFFAKVDNLFDSEYETFGLYGEPDEAPGFDFEDPRFVGAGAPRAGWIGFKITL
ncbi:TonB-dependent receptor [Methylophaga sp. OBS4]|uniref:TonB-dependent receptor n=1 Tax=Methylophaga sp. OBS4 TaxID=2991935 RepID=UPI00225C27C5|nr:TonB-dependent receptor [Methylophaga sp. OBS4]MCX4187802.1 TonB-dependent receptor [Methylophaga sp. OBS4]